MGNKKITVSLETWNNLQKIFKIMNIDKKKKISFSKVIDLLTANFLKGNDSNLVSSSLKNQGAPVVSIPEPNLSKDKKKTFSDVSLNIPPAPKKKPLKLEINQRDLDELAKKETKKTKYILIECQICGSKPISMPVPKDLVKNSKEPVVDVSYVHGDPQHVIVAQLDHDFQVRRRRASWVIFEKDYK